MTNFDLAEILEIDFISSKLFGTKNPTFYGKLIMNYRTKEWSKPLQKERLDNMKEKKGIKILIENENTVLYRCNGKLFVNKTTDGVTRGIRIL